MKLKKIDKYQELNKNTYTIIKKMSRFLKNQQLECNADKIKKEIEDSIKNDKTRIKLIGIDISKTIIEYQTSTNIKLEAAKLIKNEFIEFIDYTENQIVELIENGFKKYDHFRKKYNIEKDENYVYKKYIFYKFDNITDDQINKIKKIWKENSVKLNLNSKKIVDFVTELKKRGYIVVTISDMLGDMSTYALKKVGLCGLFDAHFCSNDFKYRKNHATNSLYNIIMKHYNLTGENCLMIGNNYNDDILCSMNNGWNAIYINFNNNTTIVNNNKLLLIVNNLDELAEKNIESSLLFRENTCYVDRKNDFDEYINNAYFIRQHVKCFANRELREKIYKTYLIKLCGDNTRLGNNIEIRNPYNIYIGDNCQINDNLTILNESTVFIGNNVMIANNVFISTYYHDWKKGMIQDDVPCWRKGDTKSFNVLIEDNCWIGPNSVIESKTIIGHHSVICGNTLVKTGVYPPYSMIGGNPGKIINNFKEKIELERIIYDNN